MVDKPRGMTSHDVVDEVRKRLRTRKVGHAGTLDPDATGVLILGVGRATRFLGYAQAAPKRYSATARLGATTSTQDASGEVLLERPVEVSRDQLDDVLGRFTGEIEQVPPMVSAVRVGGERLYAKARRGEEIEREARRVMIYSLDLVEFAVDDARLTLDVKCSAGTFVRTLVHDVGEALGCGGHLETLRRTEAAGFGIADAVALAEVHAGVLRPLAELVRALPSVELDAEQASALRHGRRVEIAAPELGDDRPVAALHDGDLVAVCRVLEARTLQPERVVAA